MSFGPIVSGGVLERAAEATLGEWLPYHIAEVARQEGHQPGDPWPPDPRTVETFSTLTTWDELPLPAILVVSTGTDGDPARDGRGRWSAWWRLAVSVIASANSHDNTRRVCHIYGAAIRSVMVTHPTLGGVSDRIDWTGEQYEPVFSDAARTLGMVTVSMRAHMADVVSHAPRVMPTPPPDPHQPWPGDPTITTTTIFGEAQKP